MSNSQHDIASNNYARQTGSTMLSSAAGSTLGGGMTNMATQQQQQDTVVRDVTTTHVQERDLRQAAGTIHTSTQFVKDQLVVEQTNETIREAPVVHEKHIYHTRPVLQEHHVYKEVPVVNRTIVHEQPSLTTREVIHELPVQIEQNAIIKENIPVKHEVQHVQHELRTVKDTDVKVVEKNQIIDQGTTVLNAPAAASSSSGTAVLHQSTVNMDTGDSVRLEQKKALNSEIKSHSSTGVVDDARAKLAAEHHAAVQRTQELKHNQHGTIPGGLQMHGTGSTLDASQTGKTHL